MNEEPQKKPNIFRRAYNWVLHLASTPYAVPAALIISFTAPWLIPFPPDLLLIPLFLAKPEKTLRLGFIAAILYALGWMVGYAVGFYGYQWFGHDLIESISGFLGVSDPNQLIPEVKQWYDKYGIWAVISSSATPISDKLFSIGSGILQYDLYKFTFAVIIGAIVRVLGAAILVKIYGPPVVKFVEKYFEWVTLGLIVVVFVVVLLL